MQPGLSVLVNVTHNNAGGCAAVAAGGGARLAAHMVTVLATARLATGASQHHHMKCGAELPSCALCCSLRA